MEMEIGEKRAFDSNAQRKLEAFPFATQRSRGKATAPPTESDKIGRSRRCEGRKFGDYVVAAAARPASDDVFVLPGPHRQQLLHIFVEALDNASHRRGARYHARRVTLPMNPFLVA